MVWTQSYEAVLCTAEEDPAVVDDVLRFRKQLFVDQYGWKIETTGDFETDQFDLPPTIYVALYHGPTLVGVQRAMPTDGPYLTADAFPQLVTRKPLPRRPDQWEISRFGVLNEGSPIRHSLINYALMFHLARLVGARSLLAFTDLNHERLLASIGINFARLGDPQVVGTDIFDRPIEVVAGELYLDQQHGPKFQRLMATLKQVRIDHAPQAFGRARVPA